MCSSAKKYVTNQFNLTCPANDVAEITDFKVGGNHSPSPLGPMKRTMTNTSMNTMKSINAGGQVIHIRTRLEEGLMKPHT